MALPLALAQGEPDHAIHEELRALVRQAEGAIDAGRYDELLPLVTDDFRATTLTQEVIQGREGIPRYFDAWFGPGKYMRSMSLSLEADELTDLSQDRTWGLVTGKGREHYEANDGSMFDFDTRWTTLMVRGDDGRWRVRAIHFGTNQLDNPVLTRVRDTLLRNGAIATGVALLAGLAIGGFLGARRARSGSAAR